MLPAEYLTDIDDRTGKLQKRLENVANELKRRAQQEGTTIKPVNSKLRCNDVNDITKAIISELSDRIVALIPANDCENQKVAEFLSVHEREHVDRYTQKEIVKMLLERKNSGRKVTMCEVQEFIWTEIINRNQQTR